MPLPLILAGAAIVAGVGVKKGLDSQKESKANDIIKKANDEYQKHKNTFDEINSTTENSLILLGDLQLKIGKELSELAKITDSLFEKLHSGNENKFFKVNVAEYDLNRITILSKSATAYLSKLEDKRMSATYAVYSSIVEAISKSIDKNIIDVSSAIATNTTLSLKENSLLPSKFTMDGGAMVLGFNAIDPFMFIRGLGLALAAAPHQNKADAELARAMHHRSEVDSSIVTMRFATKQLEVVTSMANKIILSISSIYEIFQSYSNDLRAIDVFINNRGNIEQFRNIILELINNMYQIATILTDIINTPLFKLKEINGKLVVNEDNSVEFETNGLGMQILNEEEIDNVLLVAKYKIKPFENTMDNNS